MFALGVGHLVGNDSVVERVRRAGFTVERMEEGQIPSVAQSAGGRPAQNTLLTLTVILLLIIL